MDKKVLILAITASFIISSIPLAEASISWNGFLREIGFPMGFDSYWVFETQTGGTLNALCEVGDKVLSGATTRTGGSTNDLISEPVFNVGPQGNQEGWKGGDGAGFLTIKVSAHCLRTTPSVVGGDWQATDTVALFIGYSVLNAYWLAPTLAGIGTGVYLTKSMLKKK